MMMLRWLFGLALFGSVMQSGLSKIEPKPAPTTTTVISSASISSPSSTTPPTTTTGVKSIHKASLMFTPTDQTAPKTGGEIVRARGIETRLPSPKRYRRKLHPEFVERLAHCETHKDWKNGGNWAGGLGIARSTWHAYGGHEFARTPDRATKAEQITVANRIALWGYVQPSGRYLYPVGLGGWGGLPCALPIKYAKQVPAVYPPAHILDPKDR